MKELALVLISIPSLGLPATISSPFEGKYKAINEIMTTAAMEPKTRVVKLIPTKSDHVEDSLQKKRHEKGVKNEYQRSYIYTRLLPLIDHCHHHHD